MSTTDYTTLNEECTRLLEENGLFAGEVACGLVAVFDDVGDLLFKVTSTIGAVDLGTLLRLYRSRFDEGLNEGFSAGREDAFDSLCNLLRVTRNRSDES